MGENRGTGILVNPEIHNSFPGEMAQAENAGKNNFHSILLSKFGNIEYYSVDLTRVDLNKLNEILSECEKIEKECWNAQENFFDYVSKSNFLIYAKDEDNICGFGLLSFHYINNDCMFILDECMFRNGYQGKKIAKRLVILCIRFFCVWIAWPNRVKNFVSVSISCNPKVVSDYFRSPVAKLLDNTFRPSKSLQKIYLSYIKTNSLFPVDEDKPFVLKNLFPGSNKFEKHDADYQFSEKLKKWLPDEMDHYDRGDAVAFLVRLNWKIIWVISVYVFIKYFGLQAFRNSHIGIMRRKELHLIFKGPAAYDWFLPERKLKKSF